MQSKRKRSLLVPFCVLAIAGAAVLIGWFVHMMALQTSWKNDRLRLAGYFSDAEHYGAAISCGETTIEANEQILDYYYTFLTFPRSMAVRRAADAELFDAITLKLPKTTLYLTEAPDGVSTCVLWTEDGKTHAYQIARPTCFRSRCSTSTRPSCPRCWATSFCPCRARRRRPMPDYRHKTHRLGA